MNTRLVLALTLLALFSPACATVKQAAQPVDRAAVLLSDRAPLRPSCTIATQPIDLPSVDQLADSAALSAAVASLSRDQRIGGSDVFLLLSVSFDRTGAVERVQPINWYLPEGAAEQLRSVVSTRLRHQPHGEWSVRLRVAPGATPGFKVGRSEVCPPEGLRTVHLVTPTQYSRQTPRSMRVRALVGTQGELIGAEQETSSGDSELDQWVLRTIGNMRYGPGLVDGVPVVMPVEQTVQFTQRVPSPLSTP